MRVLQRNKSLLFTVLIGISLFFSCSRETTSPGNSLSFTATLKSWLSVNGKNYSTGQISIHDNGTVRIGSLNWSNTVHFVSGDNEFYEVPFSFTAENAIGRTGVTMDVSNAPEFKMIFQRSTDGTILARIKASFINDPITTSENHATNFMNGSMFDDLDGKRKAIYIRKTNSGQPVRVYMNAPASAAVNTGLSQSKTSAKLDCDNYAVVNYSYECSGAPSNIPGDYNVTCGYVPVGVAVLSFCAPSDTGRDGFDYGGYNAGGSGGDAGIITNKITQPCLKAMVDNVINQGLNNTISKILTETFGTSDQMNITFNQAISLPNNFESQTDPPIIVNNIFNITVELSLSRLESSTKEYVTQVIFHEIIHAYLTYNDVIYNRVIQHIEMAQNYVDDLRSSMQKMFPLLSDKDANGMILSGLGNLLENFPTYFDILLSSYQLTRKDISDINKNYAFGFSGTPC